MAKLFSCLLTLAVQQPTLIALKLKEAGASKERLESSVWGLPLAESNQGPLTAPILAESLASSVHTNA